MYATSHATMRALSGQDLQQGISHSLAHIIAGCRSLVAEDERGLYWQTLDMLRLHLMCGQMLKIPYLQLVSCNLTAPMNGDMSQQAFKHRSMQVAARQGTLGARQALLQGPWGMRLLMTLASATSTSMRSPPFMRSNRK